MYISQRKVHDFSQVVLRLHQCSNLESFITEAMSLIRRVVPYENGAFFSAEPPLQLFDCSYHQEEAKKLFKYYRECYQDHEIYRKRVFSRQSLPVAGQAKELLDFDDREENELRVGFLIANTMHYLTGVRLMHCGNVLADITIHRTQKHRDFDDGERKLLKMLGEQMQYIFAKLRDEKNAMLVDKEQQAVVSRQTMVPFTVREAEILLLLAQGLSNKEIGGRLFISSETVKTHLKKLFAKTSARSRTELLSHSMKILSDRQ
ncbi:LuxR C-terminal-related transcriptional regulator [Sporomusa sp. KB1]|jgi:DNA-binding CsgD family transcriptional regulator|uniref:helix-turn-helix transcriptional regulator n=1 Tax=Sporomusa sp. KB1 TaxID=943346 RepID=UPI00119E5ED0|nr:LuxR C-terminal-related transcriptional regulator [Sporomusa sp. KB1]TWH44964.1 Response regulator containing a CheY-like receiver domain and an HTH DNA-binding domain [Sporomusa sp. KB1]